MKIILTLLCLSLFVVTQAQSFDATTENNLKDQYINVFTEIKKLIQSGDITSENSKKGFSTVFDFGGESPINFKFNGVIEPMLTGVVKINNIDFSGRLFTESEKEKITEPINIEYVISNDSVKSIRFVDPQKQFFENQYFIMFKDNLIKIIKEKNEVGNEVYGYPSTAKAYNQVFDISRKLPIYSKSPKSRSFFCAGHYLIKYNSNWIHEFCPKLITLNRYQYQGPFKSIKDVKEKQHG